MVADLTNNADPAGHASPRSGTGAGLIITAVVSLAVLVWLFWPILRPMADSANAHSIIEPTNPAQTQSQPDSKQQPAKTTPTETPARPQTRQLYPVANVRAEAASQLTDNQSARRGADYYAPVRTIDQNPATAWSEGGSGDGVGEWIRYRFAEQINLAAVRIIAGYAKSDVIFRNNCRLKRVRFDFGDGRSVERTLTDTQQWQEIDFGGAFSTDQVTLHILEVYPGAKYDDLAFSEIAFIHLAE